MSDPQQPAVPSSAPRMPAAQPAHLPAVPQYPATPPTAAHPYPPPGIGGSPAAYGSPLPGAPADPLPTRPATPLARTAFLIAVITFALNLAVSATAPLAYLAVDGYGWYNAASGALVAVSLLAYVTALVLALAAIRKPGSLLLTGIAIGVAGVGTLGIVTTWAASLFYRFF